MQTMEELIQSDPQTNFNNEEEDDDDEIYEKIEAPKFVDFTDPNPPHVLDDRSWFCLRVGCDLKHEEDMDPDAVYKRFVLRVMAARSPNLRLRKALLNKQAPSATLKCPLTAPAKSSKPRVSRMTAITNLSQKMADAKVKLHPISKLNLMTPHGKAKQIVVASKYLTTPRYKKCIPDRDPFRSVQNPKNTTAMTRGKLVAKALVFKSPKKTQKRKTVLEWQTPVTEVCSEMKKLEISSQPKKTQKRKASLECQTPVTEICSQMKKLEISKAKKSGKPSSSIPRGLTTCPTASEAKKSQLYNHNQKSRVEISRDHKDQEAKSSRRPKRKSKEKIQKVQYAAEKNPDNDLSDMEIDEKSRKGSVDVCSTVESSNSKEERLVAIAENLGVATTTQEENFSSSSETSLNGENRQTLSTDVTTGECPSSLSTSEIDLEEKDPHKFETPDEVKNESIGHEESVKSNTEEERLEPASTTGSESEAMFSDDKENALASEVIFTETEDRESILNCDNSQVKIHPHDSHDQKVNGAVTKTLKGSSNVAVTSLGGKYKKAKPTNPKPFRLRTDERGVLREAKLLAAPQREIAPVSKVPDGGDPQRRHGNEIQQDLKSNGECRHEKDSQGGNQAESDKIIQNIRPRQTPSYLKALKRVIEPKMSTAAIRGQKKLEDGKSKAAKKWDSRTTAKSPLLRQQLVKSHQRVVRTRNATVTLIKPGGLGIIKESSTTVLRPIEARPEVCGVVQTRNATVTLVTPGGLGIIKESSTTVLRPIEAKPEVCGTTPTSIPTHTSNAGAAARSTSRGKRPPTIPKEPNFHKIHTPKSCTKTPTKVISS